MKDKFIHKANYNENSKISVNLKGVEILNDPPPQKKKQLKLVYDLTFIKYVQEKLYFNDIKICQIKIICVYMWYRHNNLDMFLMNRSK